MLQEIRSRPFASSGNANMEKYVYSDWFPEYGVKENTVFSKGKLYKVFDVQTLWSNDLMATIYDDNGNMKRILIGAPCEYLDGRKWSVL